MGSDAIDPKKLTIIENGIVTEKYKTANADRIRTLRASLGINDSDKVVIMVAGLRPEEAHEALIRAAGILAPTRPGVMYLVAGDGPPVFPLWLARSARCPT